MDLANNSATWVITAGQCNTNIKRVPHVMHCHTRLSGNFGTAPGGPVPVDKQSLSLSSDQGLID